MFLMKMTVVQPSLPVVTIKFIYIYIYIYIYLVEKNHHLICKLLIKMHFHHYFNMIRICLIYNWKIGIYQIFFTKNALELINQLSKYLIISTY